MLKMSHRPKCTHSDVFAKVVDGFVIVVCGKSSQICCFYNTNKYVGYDNANSDIIFSVSKLRS